MNKTKNNINRSPAAAKNKTADKSLKNNNKSKVLLKNIYIVPIAGKQGAGKSTLAENVRKALSEKNISCKVYSFFPFRHEFSSISKKISEMMIDEAGNFNCLSDIPQILSDKLKACYGKDVFADHLMSDILYDVFNLSFFNPDTSPAVVLIDDLRYKNELDAVRRLAAYEDTSIVHNGVLIKFMFDYIPVFLTAPERLRKDRVKTEKWRNRKVNYLFTNLIAYIKSFGAEGYLSAEHSSEAEFDRLLKNANVKYVFNTILGPEEVKQQVLKVISKYTDR